MQSFNSNTLLVDFLDFSDTIKSYSDSEVYTHYTHGAYRRAIDRQLSFTQLSNCSVTLLNGIADKAIKLVLCDVQHYVKMYSYGFRLRKKSPSIRYCLAMVEVVKIITY